MTQILRKGQKMDLTKGRSDLRHLIAGFESDQPIGVCAVMLDVYSQGIGTEGFIHAGQRRYISGGVELMPGNPPSVAIELDAVPPKVARITLAITPLNSSFAPEQKIKITLTEKRKNEELISYAPDKLHNEKALILGDIYRYKGEWKFSAVGSGFADGITALLDNFGLDKGLAQNFLATSPTPPAPSPPPPTPAVKPEPPAEPVAERHIKVVLKKGQKITLVKKGSFLGNVSINLNWRRQVVAPAISSGILDSLFGHKQSGHIDLDLGCLFELSNGDKGAVQALGNSFGSLLSPPYVLLDGDDRTGSNPNGETIRINGQMVAKIKRLLLYTFIYDGITNWQGASGVVTVKCPGSPDIIVNLDEYGSNQPMCAIALVESNGKTFSVEKVVRFFSGHRDMDRAFKWNLRWVAGTKN